MMKNLKQALTSSAKRLRQPMKQPAIVNRVSSGEETVQDLVDWLRAANLMALFNCIAHDLRGPLNAMSMNLEMLKYVLGNPLKNDTDKPEYYAQILSESIRELDQGLLLFFGYFAATGQQPLPIQKLMAEVEELSITQAQTQSVRMSVKLPEQALALQSHIPAWRQSVLHLVVHALKGLGRGDELTIEAASSDSQLQLRIYDSPTKTSSQAETPGLKKVAVLASQCGGSLNLYANPGNKNGLCRELTIPLQPQ
jgi:signal transduction histidine kinase